MTLAIRTMSKDELATNMDWCTAMSGSTMLPAQYRGKAANLLFAVEYADALGIPRINALTGIHVIEGKPSASSDLIASLIRRAGHKLRVKGDDTYATAQLVRADDPDYTFEVTWNVERATAAGLIAKGGNWNKYRAAMLRARAITEVARMGASDALYGVIYTPEELGAVIDESGNPVDPAEGGNERRRMTRATSQREDEPRQQRQQRQGGAAGFSDALSGGESQGQPEQQPEATDENAQIAGDIIEAAKVATNREDLVALWKDAGKLPEPHCTNASKVIEDRVAALGVKQDDEAQQQGTQQPAEGEQGVLDAETVPLDQAA